MGVRQDIYTHSDRRSLIKTVDSIIFIAPYTSTRYKETGEEKYRGADMSLA
jgi:hypothetical protein